MVLKKSWSTSNLVTRHLISDSPLLFSGVFRTIIASLSSLRHYFAFDSGLDKINSRARQILLGHPVMHWTRQQLRGVTQKGSFCKSCNGYSRARPARVAPKKTSSTRSISARKKGGKIGHTHFSFLSNVLDFSVKSLSDILITFYWVPDIGKSENESERGFCLLHIIAHPFFSNRFCISWYDDNRGSSHNKACARSILFLHFHRISSTF